MKTVNIVVSSPPPAPPPPKTYDLHVQGLNREDMVFIGAICGAVSGSMVTTPRSVTDRIYNAIANAGISPTEMAKYGIPFFAAKVYKNP